jgi:hypothetical protein
VNFKLLLAGVVLVVPAAVHPESAPEPCATADPFAVLVSPRSVTPGESFRVLVASEEPAEGAVLDASGDSGALPPSNVRSSGGGPPTWWAAEFKAPQTGEVKVTLTKKGKTLACKAFEVDAQKRQRKQDKGIWKTEAMWTRGMENLYSAWIELLFIDDGEGASWNPLHAVTRDPAKNFLHDHLGLGEDEGTGPGAFKMRPDCADNPFFLRAYFSWKLGLPYGYHTCSRGKLQQPPKCKQWTTNEADRGAGGEAEAFGHFLKGLMNSIHSGSARTPLDAQKTDLYPVALTKKDLRPGVVFADPYGHTLVIVRWIPQTPDRPGLLLAVDAQPDGTIGIKRFWRGNFLFTASDVIGEPGFKAFRPVVKMKGGLAPMTNEQVAASSDYGNFSLQQKKMDPEDFYDAMERLINPDPLDPVSAYLDLHKALYEQLLVRVKSVASGEKFMKANPGIVIPMPEGAKIFQTTGAWEDYSTPSRDMRLLIAMNVLLGFPEKMAKNPASYNLPEGETPESMKKQLAKLHDKWSKEMTVTYVKSNGKEKTLTLAEILDRIEAFEMAYNPNDCVEVRWGAPKGSKEGAGCKRRAPDDQLALMKSYRKWFHERRYPVEE